MNNLLEWIIFNANLKEYIMLYTSIDLILLTYWVLILNNWQVQFQLL